MHDYTSHKFLQNRCSSLSSWKLQPHGFGFSPSQARPKPSWNHHLVQLGLSYFGLAWPGSWPQAGPCTALGATTLGDRDIAVMYIYYVLWHYSILRMCFILLICTKVHSPSLFPDMVWLLELWESTRWWWYEIKKHPQTKLVYTCCR